VIGFPFRGDRSARRDAQHEESCCRLSERVLEGGGGQRFERQVEDIAMGTESFQGPDEIRLDGLRGSAAMRVLNASPIDARLNSRSAHCQRRERAP
jgi:hypothetical protein